jgi:hypothetical protein
MNSFDEAYIKKLQIQTAESRTFFSNKTKEERERSIVRVFLKTLGIRFEDSELIAPSVEPVDVAFRTARFQNRELLELGLKPKQEPERKRGEELKQKEKKYKDANLVSVNQLLKKFSPHTPVSLAHLVLVDVPNALSEKSVEYPKKYPNGCRDIDALVYVNLKDKFLTIDSQLLVQSATNRPAYFYAIKGLPI